MWKKLLIATLVLLLALVASGAWFLSLVPVSEREKLVQSKKSDIAYLNNARAATGGRILAVVTSTNKMGDTDKKTGYELTELARAYWVFQANGFEVDIASPEGGKPPVIIDDDDMGIFDFAFLNDEAAQHKVNHSVKITDINPDDYQGVYFVGGKGAMFDFPNNLAIQQLIKQHHQSNKVIAAVCHGPAALVNVILDDGSFLVDNKNISAFSNSEELFLIPDAADIFPFLLESKLKQQGANYQAAANYLEKISWEGNLITGQNPWSVWALAEAVVTQLGYQPMPRIKSAEENTIDLLAYYQQHGFDKTQHYLQASVNIEQQQVLLLMHAIVALMEFKVVKSSDLIRLTLSIKEHLKRPTSSLARDKNNA